MNEKLKEKREFGYIYKRSKRSKRTGELYELPFWWIRYHANGKVHRESSKSADRGVAEKLLAEREFEAKKGLFVAPSEKQVTFADLAADFLTHYERKGFDLRRAKISVANLRRFFGDKKKALDIGTGEAQRYEMKRRKEKAANATIRLELCALTKMFNLAVRAKRLLPAQVPNIEKPKANNVRQGFFHADDLRAVLDELPDFLRPVVEFLSLTGWRVSEALGLTWEQVDFEAGTVRLEPGTTKNDEGREFPFYPPLKALLETQRERARALERKLGQVGTVRQVFYKEEAGTFHRIGDFRKTWFAALDRAAHGGKGPKESPRELVRPALAEREVRDPETGKVRKVHPLVHDLRRTAVRRFVREGGMSEKKAMLLTGHKTRAVFDRYDITNLADLRDAVAKLSGTETGAHSRGTPAQSVGGGR